MKLKKSITTERFEVLARYTKTTENHFFLPVLKLAETHEVLTPQTLKAELLPNLPESAARNILNRMAEMEYLVAKPIARQASGYTSSNEAPKTEAFVLTETGREMSRKGIVEEQHYALLELTIGQRGGNGIGAELTEQTIFKIEERPQYDQHKNKGEIKNHGLLKGIDPMKTQSLKNGNFRIVEIERVIKQLDNENLELKIEANAKNAMLHIGDYQEAWNDVNEQQIERELLSRSGYSLDRFNRVPTPFFADDLRFFREVRIDSPWYKGLYFDSLEIPKVHFFPRGEFEAHQWHERLVASKIDRQVTSEEEFAAIMRQEASHFQEWESKLGQWMTRTQLAERAQHILSAEKAFYLRSRLTTIDFLNY